MPANYHYLALLCMTLIAAPAHSAVTTNTESAQDQLTSITTPLQQDNSQFSSEQQQRLDLLFTRLASSDNEGAARQLIAEIWSIWKQPVDKALMEKMIVAEKLYVQGKQAESFAVLDAMIAAYPNYSEIWNQRATYYYHAGRYTDSLADIAKVLELEPRHFGALSGKIAILLREGRTESAVKTLRQALKINPFMPEARMLLPKQPAEKSPGLAI